MTKLKRGMVIDVNLDPTQGSETGKIRPCIIVTNNVYNERVPVIQVVPVTAWSDKKARITTNIEILPSAANGLSKSIDCRLPPNTPYRSSLQISENTRKLRFTNNE